MQLLLRCSCVAAAAVDVGAVVDVDAVVVVGVVGIVCLAKNAFASFA
jgi:hypothetical protein